MISKPEIVSPAGNPEKLKFAVKYGADAVYFGGNEFNLRIQAGNFSFEELAESAALCRKNSVKTIFLLNSFLHEKDLNAAVKNIKKISSLDFDAVMISDPGMLLLLKDSGIKSEFHLSTQMNTLNHLSVKFWSDAGFKRIVLGRETTIEEIRKIRDNTDAEIEIFVHGALCIAYSGRCLLSRYLSGRDANGGDCSQPCRWKYSLVEEKRAGNYLNFIEHASGTEILSSKDLCLIEKLEEYIGAGVNAFKIEGRMKSLYHAANTTRIYKHAARLAGSDEFKKHLPFWLNELDMINHRPYTSDLFNEFENLEFTGVPYLKKAVFTGYRLDDSPAEISDIMINADEAWIKIFNPVYPGDTLEGIFPIIEHIKDDIFRIEKIYDTGLNETEIGRPSENVLIKFDKPVGRDVILRKRL